MYNVSVPHSYIQEIQSLFEVDPLLLRLFVKVVALEDLKSLIDKVPVSLLIMRLIEISSQGKQVL